MTETERRRRPTLRITAFGENLDSELLERMRNHLPSRGIATTSMLESSPLPRSALRIADNRILSTALRFLDQDATLLLLAGIKRIRALADAARDTRDAPGDEIVVTLIHPYTITSNHRPEVTLFVDESEVAKIPFDLNATFSMGETGVAVRDGAIESVHCETGKLTVELSLHDCPPLLRGSATFPLQQQIRPPITIPAAADGRPFIRQRGLTYEAGPRRRRDTRTT